MSRIYEADHFVFNSTAYVFIAEDGSVDAILPFDLTTVARSADSADVDQQFTEFRCMGECLYVRGKDRTARNQLLDTIAAKMLGSSWPSMNKKPVESKVASAEAKASSANNLTLNVSEKLPVFPPDPTMDSMMAEYTALLTAPRKAGPITEANAVAIDAAMKSIIEEVSL
jgi:hypothetical protein